MKFASLNEWLIWVKSQHVKEMDLSLERVQLLTARLNLLQPKCPVVTVAGTNGKGSTVAGLEAIYLAAGFKVGAFTSPYLYQYNEQIRLQGIPVSDELICQAFEKITIAAENIRLTQFELGTLAALVIFHEADLDVFLLEVGLGGRYDAVNVCDADVAVITSIGIDHVEWLGHTREAIALEKAGIMRPNRPVVCGDFFPPSTLIEYADQIKAPLFCQGKEFGFVEKESSWDFWGLTEKKDLPIPVLALQNMAIVLQVIELLQEKLAVKKADCDQGFKSVSLPGRIEVISGKVTHIFDVSHNPASVAMFAKYLEKNEINGKTHAVFSMLADKDILTSIKTVQNLVSFWYTGALPGERGASMDLLESLFKEANIFNVNVFQGVEEAYQTARQKAEEGDRIIIFGSFHTVAMVGRDVKQRGGAYV